MRQIGLASFPDAWTTPPKKFERHVLLFVCCYIWSLAIVEFHRVEFVSLHETQEQMCGLKRITGASINTGVSGEWAKFQFLGMNYPFKGAGCVCTTNSRRSAGTRKLADTLFALGGCGCDLMPLKKRPSRACGRPRPASCNRGAGGNKTLGRRKV